MCTFSHSQCLFVVLILLLHYYSHFSVYFGLCMCSSNTISDNSLPMISIFFSMCGILFTHFLSMLNIRLCVLFSIVGAFVKANIP